MGIAEVLRRAGAVHAAGVRPKEYRFERRALTARLLRLRDPIPRQMRTLSIYQLIDTHTP